MPVAPGPGVAVASVAIDDAMVLVAPVVVDGPVAATGDVGLSVSC